MIPARTVRFHRTGGPEFLQTDNVDFVVTLDAKDAS